jgi:peroxiredoxin Q/BCP
MGLILALIANSSQQAGVFAAQPSRSLHPMTEALTPAGTPERVSVGQPAPDFILPTADGGQFALADHRGRNVIIYFYPAAMTPGCTTQACDFRDSFASLQAEGYDVVGISPDPLDKLVEFADKEQLTFPLAADPDKTVMTGYGAYGEKMNYGKKVTGVIRSTIVVDPDGNVRLAQYNVKATGHVARLRRDLGLD